jgi:hypothetical protein
MIIVRMKKEGCSMEDFNIFDFGKPEGYEKCEGELGSFITCERVVHQKEKVSLPIAVEPFVVTGKIKAKCCGNPKIIVGCKDNCSFVLSQELCIEIPVKFGVATEIKEKCVECEVPYIEEDCKD